MRVKEFALPTYPEWVAGVLASATEAIISVDENQNIILFNHAAEDIFRYSAEDVLGRPLDTLIPERYRARHAKDFAGFAGGGQRPRRMAAGRVVMARRADGTEFPAEASISQVKQDGTSIMTVILRDVSEQEASIRRLADSEALFRSLVDQFPGFVYTMELSPTEDGDDQPRVTYASSRAVSLLGRAPDAFYKDPELWLEVIHPDSREVVRYSHIDCLREGTPVDSVIRLQHSSGEMRTMLNRADRVYVHDVDGGRRALLQGFMIDFTERELLHEKLVRSERMAEAGRLAAIVAHEINSPITAIRGCFEVLLSRVELDATLKEYTETALEEAKRVATLSRQLRDYGLPSQETMRSLQMNDLVSNIASMTRNELQKHDIEVSVVPESDLPLIFGDPHELKQVIWNLVANAWDAMPEGGHLTIRTGRDEASNDHICLEISDTGKGIPSDIRPMIFNMFFTTKDSSRSGGGAGLGLAISHKILERHNGRIEFESEEGKGTQFRVYLPVMNGLD